MHRASGLPSILGVLAFALAAAGIFSGSAAAAGDATFTIDSETDAVDANPGDGVCATAAGECTLRAAVQETNALPGHQTIVLPPGEFVLTIPGYVENESATGDLDVTDDVTIRGAGVDATFLTENSGGVERIIDVRQGATAVVSDLAIHDVFMSAILPFDDACGGGIRNYGNLTAFRLVIRDNVFRRGGGGVCNEQGGVLTVTDSLIHHNCACLTGPGGGILNGSGGFAVLERLTISGNHADTTGGGGISNFGSMIVRDSAVVGNHTGGNASGAGGIDNRNFGEDGFLTIINSTITGNVIDSSRGGGISNQHNGTVTVINSTVVSNASMRLPPFVDEPMPAPNGGGVSTDAGSTTALINTVVASNDPFDCAEIVSGFFVLPTSEGHNIDSDGSCQLSGPGDISGVDPLLGELADNGGPTLTHALLAGSPAIDAGDDAECPDADQRGAPRPAGAACDIGAYEAGSEVPPPPDFVHGDIDCDGAVTPFDVLKTLRYIVGLPFMQEAGCPALGSGDGPAIFGDVNCDGAVDALDALQTLRHLAALPVHQNEGCPQIGGVAARRR